MRIVAHLLVAVTLLGALGLPALAQTPTPETPTNSYSGKGGNSEKKLQKMATRLGLSADQVTQIRQIFQTTAKGKERRRAIMAVLTPQQRATMKAAHHGRKGASPTNNTPTNTAPTGT